MREVDVKTPYANEIKRYRDNMWGMGDLKQVEIEIADALGWNLGFLTYWDYLEHYLSIGV
jgi:hypothetical protein